MTKKFFSKILMLAMFAGVFGFAVYQLANADVATTSTTVGNVVPTITAGPSDGSSGSGAGQCNTATNPTCVGSNVNFSVTATDPNSDNYYLAICKGNNIATGNLNPPTCPDAAWGVSGSTVSGNPASTTTSTTGLANESYAWWAFVCDANASGLCSLSAQGTGDTGSPFHVNHRPVIGTVTIDDGASTIAPNETVNFHVVVTDTDTNAAPDNIMMYVCSGDADNGGVTTAFVPGASPACTNGTLLCSDTTNASGNTAACSDTTSMAAAPIAHGTNIYNVKIYLQDNHYMTDDLTNNAKTWTVIDVAPTLNLSYGTNGYTNTDAPVISGGGSDTVSWSAGITDLNGDGDLVSAIGVFFDDTPVNYNCTADEKNCYSVSCSFDGASSAPAGHEATGSDTTRVATCVPTIWFNANASTEWFAYIKPSDQLGEVTSCAQSNGKVTNPTLLALDISQGSIAYGTVAIGGTSAGQTTSIQNMGNQLLDAVITGTDMSASGPTIGRAQQKWHHTTLDFAWDSVGYALVQTGSSGGGANGCADRDEVTRATHENDRCDNGTTACTVATQGTACSGIGGGTCSRYSTDESVFWKIKIPTGQAAGNYAGTNTFTGAANSYCTGGEV